MHGPSRTPAPANRHTTVWLAGARRHGLPPPKVLDLPPDLRAGSMPLHQAKLLPPPSPAPMAEQACPPPLAHRSCIAARPLARAGLQLIMCSSTAACNSLPFRLGRWAPWSVREHLGRTPAGSAARQPCLCCPCWVSPAHARSYSGRGLRTRAGACAGATSVGRAGRCRRGREARARAAEGGVGGAAGWPQAGRRMRTGCSAERASKGPACRGPKRQGRVGLAQTRPLSSQALDRTGRYPKSPGRQAGEVARPHLPPAREK